MRQRFTDGIRIAVLFLLLGLLFAGGFLLPAQYEDTFLGELKYKYERLYQTEGKRLILVGGSSVAFGVDSKLLAAEFPDYEVINFGMYAGLGTTCMLELSEDALRAGDLVIVIPEQQARTLSNYFDGTYFWQAADGAFSLLLDCAWENWGKLGMAFPQFSIEKWKLFLSGTHLQPEDVYARASFDAAGDIVSEAVRGNQMPDGYDVNVPILFDTALLTDAFVQRLNQYTKKAQAQGAAVWYHFCPMNAAAVSQGADINGYSKYLTEQLDCPLAGEAQACIMDAGWFYDTNFHLNAAGKTVYTRQLAMDIKELLGDETPVDIALPEMPEPAAQPQAHTADASTGAEAAAYFAWEERAGTITLTGLTALGSAQQELTIPAVLNGLPVTRIAGQCFSEGTALERIRVGESVTVIENGAFSGCARLETIALPWETPSVCMVGEALLDGTHAVLAVPQQAVNAYKLNYTWSLYADRIKTGGF